MATTRRVEDSKAPGLVRTPQRATVPDPRQERPVRVRLALAVPLLLVGLLVPRLAVPSRASHVEVAPIAVYGPTTDSRTALRRAIGTYDLQVDALMATIAAAPKPRVRRNIPTAGSHRGYGSAKECAAMVEHGGNYDRSSNPSHFGRYQFSRGTWAAYGGNPETWGSASPEEQDAVFETAWNAPGGPSNWLPYDHC